MKTYEVMKTCGTPNWDTVPSVTLDQYLWSDVRSIQASAQAAWEPDGLYVRLQASEPKILARFTGHLDEVCKDSCLEFFFCPMEGDRYFNIECNPNGALYVGYGRPGSQRTRLYRTSFPQILQIKPFTTNGGWGIEMRVPVEFVQMFVPDFSFYAGQTLRANFFKCGDETEKEHYMSWNPVEVPQPNFHLPEFFGMLKLV